MTVMLSHLSRITGDFAACVKYFQIAGVSYTRESQGGVSAEDMISIPLQDQRNVQAFSPHFIHIRARTAVQMGSLAWEGVLVHGRGLPIWEDVRFAGTAGEEQRQESFAR